MDYKIVKRQVREINRKLFANDIFYEDNEENENFTSILSGIIQTYNAEDILSNTPTILEIKDNNVNEKTLDKLKLLSKKSVYIQFNNRIISDSSKLSIVRALKSSGYNIIIEVNEDDEMFTIAKVLATIIKLNIKAIPKGFISGPGVMQCKTLAYNVDTPEDYVLAESTGISLYEGEYISESSNLQVLNVQHSNVGFLEIVCLFNDKQVDIQKLVQLISQDSLLSSQVLRLSNSRYFKSDKYIESVGEAVVRIGIDRLRRWVFLLEFARNDNPKEDILEASYYRALFCERMAIEIKESGIKASEAYLIGLLSQLDILTGRPLAIELASLNISRFVKDALMYKDNSGGYLLNLAMAYEELNDKRIDKYCSMLKIKKERLSNIYSKAVLDAKNTWKDMTEYGGVYL